MVEQYNAGKSFWNQFEDIQIKNFLIEKKLES